MPLLADADWVQVVAALIFFVITGVAQFLQKRARERQGLPPLADPESLPDPGYGRETAPPPIQREPHGPPRDDWQEQLRRLLEGERPQEDAPPVIIPPTRSSPARPSNEPSEEESVSWENSSRPSAEEVSLEDAPAGRPLKSEAEWNTATRLHTEDHMATAANAYRQASNLHELTSARLRGVRERTTSPSAQPPTVVKRRSTASAQMVAMLRRPDSLRQAILVTAILQSPKALQDSPRNQ
ncbi:MAG: hypothetical protein JNK85_00500 [Verrucomicrobiales bacterium]|nr:hypothetical protein [Verrucomicrobiales bacterium]